MPPKEPPTSRLELLQGTLDFIILQALRWGPCHGYGLVQLIRSQSGNVLQVETGSLYPALQRLLRQRADGDEVVGALVAREQQLGLVGDRHVGSSGCEQLERGCGIGGDADRSSSDHDSFHQSSKAIFLL